MVYHTYWDVQMLTDAIWEQCPKSQRLESTHTRLTVAQLVNKLTFFLNIQTFCEQLTFCSDPILSCDCEPFRKEQSCPVQHWRAKKCRKIKLTSQFLWKKHTYPLWVLPNHNISAYHPVWSPACPQETAPLDSHMSLEYQSQPITHRIEKDPIIHYRNNTTEIPLTTGEQPWFDVDIRS